MPKTFAIHPGAILREEFIEPLELTVYRLAKELGVTGARMNEVVTGKRGITADTALRLSIYFGNSAQFWMNLQNDYDLRLAKTADLSKIKPRRAA